MRGCVEPFVVKEFTFHSARGHSGMKHNIKRELGLELNVALSLLVRFL
jgi:hypothetical protein